jgi:hypothetical protein
MSSPVVTFNLRSVVGGARRREAEGGQFHGSPAPRAPLRESDDPPAFGRLGSIVGASARTETTRMQSEDRLPGGDGGSGALFRYAARSIEAVAPPPPVDLRSSSVRSASPSDGGAVFGPSTEDLRKRFEEMDRDAVQCLVHPRVPQVVTSGDVEANAHRPRRGGDMGARDDRERVFRYAAEGGPNQLLGTTTGVTERGVDPASLRAGGSRRHDEHSQPRPQPAAASRGYEYFEQDEEFGSHVTRSYGEDDASELEQRHLVESDAEGYLAREVAFDDDAPIVPMELLRNEEAPGNWEDHPARFVVLALLEQRGVIPPQHMDVVRYHMALAFLEFIGITMGGSYFIKYGLKGTAPKERFVRLRILSDEHGRMVPNLVITLHREGVQLQDRIRLQDLVGITRGIDGPAFRRHLVHFDVIKGSFVGQHRARLSTKGAFTLWFYDRRSRQPKSLDLLTTNLNVFEVWTRTMEGILSVNSVCIHRSNIAQEMQRLFRLAQDAIAADDQDEN